MKYFVEKSEHDFGNSKYIEVSELPKHNIFEVGIVDGKYLFHLYLFPYEGAYLLAAWFNLDTIFNINHLEDRFNIPKFIKKSEFEKLKPIFVKSYPNYVNAYERGLKKDFSEPVLLKIKDTIDCNDYKWCLCSYIESDYDVDDNFYQRCDNLLSYLIEMLKQFHENEPDNKKRFALNLKEGIRIGIKHHFSILHILSDVYVDIDWDDLIEKFPS